MKRRWVAVFVLMMSALAAWAQPGGGPPPDPGQPLPITGIEFLLLGGAAMGAGRLLLRKAQNRNRES